MPTLDNERPAALLHDTLIILEVNEKFLALFRCTREQVIDRNLIDLIADPDLRGLGRARMRILRETGHVPEFVDYEFLRFDGTTFRGRGRTVATDEAGIYKSTIEPELGEA